MTSILKSLAAGVFAVTLVTASPASALTYSFDNITNNSPTNATTGEGQLTVSVENETTYCTSGFSCALFTFINTGTAASSITDVYWDDDSNSGSPGLLDYIFGMIDADENSGDSGVDFSVGASPGNLPGGNGIGFQADPAGATADSDPPIQPKGVNPGESLGVIFVLLSGNAYTDVFTAMNSGALRVGIHVQGFANGGSESFVNGGSVCVPGTFGCGPPVVGEVPLPAALYLLLSGIFGMRFVSWRRGRKMA